MIGDDRLAAVAERCVWVAAGPGGALLAVTMTRPLEALIRPKDGSESAALQRRGPDGMRPVIPAALLSLGCSRMLAYRGLAVRRGAPKVRP